MTTETELKLAGRSLILERHIDGDSDAGAHQSLRAWDAADEQLVEQVRSRPQGRLVVIDDAFGALSLSLAERQPTVVADSATFALALAHNAAFNGQTPPVTFDWRHPPKGPFDLVVLKIPRQLDYLEYLLRWANDVLAPDGTLIAGGMVKHLPSRCAAVFKARMGSNSPLPARRKARVILAARGQAGLADFPALWRGYETGGNHDTPERQADNTRCADAPGCLMALPAVFAREQLDVGTRVFLPQVAALVRQLPAEARVLDLGCGNGVVGITALIERPDIVVDFADVSSQAVASAQHNVGSLVPCARTRFVHCDGVPGAAQSLGAEGYELILCNPPFHDGGTVGDHIALRLFQESARALDPGGRLLIIGNRHLGYHRKLKRWFKKVRQVDDHPKFVVLLATHYSP